MKTIAIYNITQARKFVQAGCKVVDVKKRKSDNKVAIIFLVDDLFNECMDKWRRFEFDV